MGKKKENDMVFLNGNAKKDVVLEMTEPNDKQIAAKKDINKNVSHFPIWNSVSSKYSHRRYASSFWSFEI